MNEKEERVIGRIISRVMDFQLSKYQTMFLSQLAIRRYKVKSQKKAETIEESATKVMRWMPDLCRKTKGLEHKKNLVQTSSIKSLDLLEEELCESQAVSDELLAGDIVKNVLEFLLEEL